MLCRMDLDGVDARDPQAREDGAQVIRLRPLRVLVASRDHRFRAVTSMLLSRRGCTPFSAGDVTDTAATIARERIDVALVDGLELLREIARDVALGEARTPAVGVVVVGDGAPAVTAGIPTLAKWDDFDRLFAAIVRADRARARARATDGAAVDGLPGVHRLG